MEGKRAINQKKGMYVYVIVGILIGIVLSLPLTMTLGKQNNVNTFSNDKKMKEILNLIDANYLDKGSEEFKLIQDMESFYKNYVSSLKDPYTEYYTKEEYDSIMNAFDGKFYGIGVRCSKVEGSGELFINEVFSDTPAKRAGLQIGDKVIEVDGQDIRSMELETAISLVKGPEGSSVVLSVIKADTDKEESITVEREEISVASVSGEKLKNDIGYIKISEFSSDTGTEFSDELERLKEEGVKKLIIDLRNNPGGLIDSTVDIADSLLGKANISYAIDNRGRKETWDSDLSKDFDGEIVILVNGESASASELLSGAIQDNNRGIIVGEKTFGKGVVQKIFPLSDGSALKITVSEYFTPKSKKINKIGVVPDVEIKLDIEEYKKGNDNQLNKAIELLSK